MYSIARYQSSSSTLKAKIISRSMIEFCYCTYQPNLLRQMLSIIERCLMLQERMQILTIVDPTNDDVKMHYLTRK